MVDNGSMNPNNVEGGLLLAARFYCHPPINASACKHLAIDDILYDSDPINGFELDVLLPLAIRFNKFIYPWPFELILETYQDY